MKLSRGYTLIELVVVVLIVGILAAFGVPQYLKTVETSKADDAVALVNMVGTTNKMFALDHGNTYALGQFPITNCAVAGACPAGPPYAACALIWCKYLANQDFAAKAYNIFACDGGACAGVGGTFVSGARRKAGAAAPYSTWAFTMSTLGTISAYGTNPPTPSY